MPDPGSEQAELEKIRGQLRALRSSTYTSQSDYSGDVETLRQYLNSIDDSSPVVSSMISYLQEMLNEDSYDESFDSAINAVSNSIP